MTTLRHYTRASIDQLPRRSFANFPIGATSAFFAEVVAQGVERFVENAAGTRMEVVTLDDLCIPIVVNDGANNSCYFVSPHGHYVRYAREEIRKTMPLDPTTVTSMAALTALGALGKCTGFNRHVSVNNWLMSTNPPLALSADQARRLVEHLQRRFSDHAIVFRTIPSGDLATQESLTKSGGALLLNRDVHLWFPEHYGAFGRSKRKNIRVDRSFLRKHYQSVPLSRTEEFQRAAALYRKLYCDKHSARNARFTGRFFEALSRAGVGDHEFLCRDGDPKAFVFSYRTEEMLYAVFAGYDPHDAPRDNRQYRSTIAAMMDAARVDGLPLFLSTGVARFKKARGSVVEFEYEAFFVDHLPRRRRMVWRLAKAIYDRILDALDMDAI